MWSLLYKKPNKWLLEDQTFVTPSQIHTLLFAIPNRYCSLFCKDSPQPCTPRYLTDLVRFLSLLIPQTIDTLMASWKCDSPANCTDFTERIQQGEGGLEGEAPHGDAGGAGGATTPPAAKEALLHY